MRARRLNEFRARLLRNIFELASSNVPEHAVVLEVFCRLEGIHTIIHVGVGRKDILPSVIVEIEKSDTPAAIRSTERPHSRPVADISELTLAAIPKQRKSLACERGYGNVWQSVIIDISKIRTHTGHLCTRIGQSCARIESYFLEAAIPQIVEEGIRELIVGDEKILVTITVVIGHTDSHPFAGVFCQAGCLGHISEASAAQIAIELVRCPSNNLGWQSSPDVAFLIAAESIVAGSPLDVIHDEKIQETVVIEVQPRGPNRPLAAAYARLRRHIFECAVTAISIQDVLADTRDKKVNMAVVVEVPCRGRHRVTVPFQPGNRGHVTEAPPSFIAEQSIPLGRGFLR